MPDNIFKHAARLLTPYVRHVNADQRIESARALARLALENDNLLPQHRKKMISDAIWYCTEADGKWKTRYKSKMVMDLAQNEPTSLVLINHEHVMTRRNLISRILAADRDVLLENPSELHKLLDTAIGCIVTSAEHATLLEGDGWARYVNVSVCDTAIVPPQIVQLHIAGLLQPGNENDS